MVVDVLALLARRPECSQPHLGVSRAFSFLHSNERHAAPCGRRQQACAQSVRSAGGGGERGRDKRHARPPRRPSQQFCSRGLFDGDSRRRERGGGGARATGGRGRSKGGGKPDEEEEEEGWTAAHCAELARVSFGRRARVGEWGDAMRKSAEGLRVDLGVCATEGRGEKEKRAVRSFGSRVFIRLSALGSRLSALSSLSSRLSALSALGSRLAALSTLAFSALSSQLSALSALSALAFSAPSSLGSRLSALSSQLSSQLSALSSQRSALSSRLSPSRLHAFSASSLSPPPLASSLSLLPLTRSTLAPTLTLASPPLHNNTIGFKHHSCPCRPPPSPHFPPEAAQRTRTSALCA